MNGTKVSLKAKITMAAILLFIVSFAAMVFISLHFMEDLMKQYKSPSRAGETNRCRRR